MECLRKPTAPDYYNQATLWADDIQAVLTALSLRKPILVGWSYGGYVINDYLAQYGDGAVGGINYVCAGVVMGRKKATNMLGSDFINTVPGLCSDNLEDNIQAVQKVLRVLFQKQPSSEEFEVLVACSMVVPPTARLGMFSRTDRPRYCHERTQGPRPGHEGRQRTPSSHLLTLSIY